MPSAHRGTIHCEEAEVLDQRAWPGGQYVLRLSAPRCAAAARPGSFVHLQCDPELPMRRPLSIQWADPAEGRIEVLYKVVGQGLAALARRRPGETLSVLGPVGNGFTLRSDRRQAVLIGGGVGIPPLVFLARALADAGRAADAVAFFGSELPFPCELNEAPRPFDGIPDGATAAVTRLEALGVASRLASGTGLAGAWEGHVTELAGTWLRRQPEGRLAQTVIYACGPTPMLRAVQALSADTGVPAELCLEEYMACAVGGCAGCVVPVIIDGRKQMKRVCVDGPVFDAARLTLTAG